MSFLRRDAAPGHCELLFGLFRKIKMVSHRARGEHRENFSMVLTLDNTSLLCDLRGLCVSFFPRHANLKVGAPSRPAKLKFGVPRAFTSIFSLCFMRPPCESCF